jgi:cell cycle protein kinase DBF2
MASRHENDEFKLPIPPPALHMRPGNEYYNQPTTPSQYGFTSPPQTPQGSPSKHQMPPGAHDLPNVFDNAMRLIPPTAGPTSNIGRSQPNSPTKSGIPIAEDHYVVDFPDYSAAGATAPGSPTRKSNKENTPPGIRPSPKKEPSYINQAAQSRQEAYKTREEVPKQTIQRGLSQEDIDKLQKPSIKRLANVTQLCEFLHGKS